MGPSLAKAVLLCGSRGRCVQCGRARAVGPRRGRIRLELVGKESARSPEGVDLEELRASKGTDLGRVEDLEGLENLGGVEDLESVALEALRPLGVLTLEELRTSSGYPILDELKMPNGRTSLEELRTSEAQHWRR